MTEWSETAWRVISGEKPPPNPGLFKLEWNWKLFQLYNELAVSAFRPVGVRIIDIVALTRLRPTYDWRARPGEKFDCLHGNSAVHEWNTVFMNVAAADLCTLPS